MKTFLKKTLILLAIIFTATIVTNFSNATSVHAREMGVCGPDDYLLGLAPWDCNVTNDWQGEENLKKNIWIIVSNISNDITVIAAYLILGYVIYGGYLYMFAAGDVGKTATGKKTLVHAFTGLAIVMLAKIIINSIGYALLRQDNAFNADCVNSQCVAADTLVSNLIQWIIGIAGVVAVIFIVIGAVGYITSSGDAGKLQKAKNTIIYALIGLAIVGLAQIITAFVSSTIRDAKTSQNDTTLIIAKESSHEN